MLDKLEQLSKKLLIIFLAATSSCGPKYPDTNTEIVCPSGSAMLIKFIRAKDLRAAINESYKRKKLEKTSENFTVVRLPDKRSFSLKMSPEYAASCELRETKIGEVENDYIHHF